MNLHLPKRCDAKLAARAQTQLAKWESGDLKAQSIARLSLTRLEVGQYYRLVTYNHVDWFLMSHQKYDNITSTKQRNTSRGLH